MEIITIVVKKQHVYQKAHVHFDNSPKQIRLNFTEPSSRPNADTEIKTSFEPVTRTNLTELTPT